MKRVSIRNDCADAAAQDWTLLTLDATEADFSGDGDVCMPFDVTYVRHLFHQRRARSPEIVYASPGSILAICLDSGRITDSSSDEFVTRDHTEGVASGGISLSGRASRVDPAGAEGCGASGG